MCKIVISRDFSKRAASLLAVLALLASLVPGALEANDKKKKKSKEEEQAEIAAKIKAIDYSFIVWPNPPAVARIRYTNWYSSVKEKRNVQGYAHKPYSSLYRCSRLPKVD